MEWLNYHHLHYFWVTAQLGGVQAAARHLAVSPSTVSGQIKALEAQIGDGVFRRSGRSLALTDTGRLILEYAHEIFSLGEELKDVINGQRTGRITRLAVGIADVMPKHVAHRLLAPALAVHEGVRLTCRADHPDVLLAELAAHRLDVVITDGPAEADLPVQVYNHLLGSSPLALFGTSALRARYGEGFPESLHGAPMLLPFRRTALRGLIEQWLSESGVRPRIVGEFEDSGLLKIFGGQGAGLFVQPALVRAEIEAHFGVTPLGVLPGVMDRFYCLTAERRLVHPVVATLVDTARDALARLGDITPG